MYEPFNKLKFYGAASYVDQVRAGINYFVAKKGKKALSPCTRTPTSARKCRRRPDAGRQAQDQVVETTTHKAHRPGLHRADPRGSRRRACDLVVLAPSCRDSIVPYRRRGRSAGPTSIFLGSAASYDLFVAAAQGGVTEGLYAMGLTDMPYSDTFGPAAQAWFDRYKER